MPSVEVPEMLVRDSVPEIDAVLGKAFTTYCKGFVRPVDYMGSEASIVRAARVSYGKGTKKVSEDRGLIRYLLRHSHTTPFEMCEIVFHVRIPMDTWRQMIRHRTASVNEYSTRYSEAIDDKAFTLPGEWRFQSTTNKQGSGDFLPEWADCETCGGGPPYMKKDGSGPCECVSGARLTKREAEFHRIAAEVYQDRLKAGVAREQARKDLPLSTYTEAYWKIDLHNLLHYLSLRLDTHAQKEIRTFAETIYHIVKMWVPNVCEAFEDYNFRRSALLLTRLDVEVIRAFYEGHEGCERTAEKVAEGFGWLERRADGTLKDNRERTEFDKKVARLFGVIMPWNVGVSS